MARVGPDQKQDPGTSSEASVWDAGAQTFGPSSTVFPGWKPRPGSEVEQPKEKTPTSIWDAGMTAALCAVPQQCLPHSLYF